MILWSKIKGIVFPVTREIGLTTEFEKYFRDIYSNDETILCLRVVFAEWTENFILRTYPLSFIRGLAFLIGEKLTNWSLRDDDFHSFDRARISKRLKRCKFELRKMIEDESKQKIFYTRFIFCFEQELKLLANMGFDMSLLHDTPVASNLREYHDSGHGDNEEGKIFGECFINEVSAQMNSVHAKLNLLISEIDTQLEAFKNTNKELDEVISNAEVLASFFPESQNMATVQQFDPSIANLPADDIHRHASLTVFWRKAMEAHGVNEKLQKAYDTALKKCREFLNMIEELEKVVERKQQFFTMGIKYELENSQEVIDSALSGIQQYSTKLLDHLKLIEDPINSTRQDTMKKLVTKMIPHTTQNIMPELENPTLITGLLSFHLDAQRLREEVAYIRVSLYKISALFIRKQPDQVKRTETSNFMSLRILSTGKASGDETLPEIEKYLITEETANIIKTRKALPEPIPSLAKVFDSLNVENGGAKRRRVRQKSNDSTDCFRLVDGYLEIDLELSVKWLDRNVFKQKYAFLIVAKLAENIKVWKVSLPLAITTNTSQNEDGWAMISCSNTFPHLTKICFEDETLISGSQVLEMLVCVFRKWVNVPLKPSHVTYIRKKLVASMNAKNLRFEDGVTWKALCSKLHNVEEFTFWAWFFRAAKVLTENDDFKEAFEKGYIEAFIGWEDASCLLMQTGVKPGTFLFRFSDSESGSLSLIWLGFDGKTYRMKPCELYKQRSFKDCQKIFLELLDAKDPITNQDVFRWVYPNIPKKLAFSKFYQDSPQSSPPPGKKLKPHYVPLISSVAVASSSPPASPVLPLYELDQLRLRGNSESSRNEDNFEPMINLEAEHSVENFEFGREDELQNLMKDLWNYDMLQLQQYSYQL